MKKILSIRGTEVNDKMYDLTVSKEFVEEVTPENISDNIMNYLRINFEFNGDIINIDFRSDIRSIFITLNEKLCLNDYRYKLKENDVIKISDISILEIFPDTSDENDLIMIRISNTRGKYWNTVFLRTLIRSIFVTKGIVIGYKIQYESCIDIFLSKSDLNQLNRIELISLILYSEKNAENLSIDTLNGRFYEIRNRLNKDS